MTIDELAKRLENLERAFIQSQRNNVAVTEKADKTVPLEQNVQNITPVTMTQRAYLGDTSCTFTDVKDGNTTVYCVTDSGRSIPTTFERIENALNVYFDELEEIATVTISIV